MTVIRVDPSLLKGFASTMQGIGGEVSSAAGGAAAAAESAPSYDGQFGPQVWPIGAEALARVSGFVAHNANLSERLNLKAIDFEGADTAIITGLGTGFKDWLAWENQMLVRLSQMTGIPVAELERYLKLGMLFGGPSFYGLLIGMVMSNSLYSWTGQTFMGLQKPSWWPNWIPWPGGTTKPETKPQSKSPQPSTTTTQQTQIPVYESQYGEWKLDPMGPNGNIGRFGCTITSLTMLARYYGINITPRDFNKWLTDPVHYGYATDSSNLIWSKAQDYLNSLLSQKFGHAAKFVNVSLNSDSINAELNQGRPVLLHVPGPDKDNGHYILAIPPAGKEGNFTILDPANQSNTTVSIKDVEGAQTFQ